MSKAVKSESPADLKERLAASYDRIAPTYQKWTDKNSNPRLQMLQKLLDRLPADSPLTILELGAGAGLPTTEAILEHRNDIEVRANDLSPVQLGLLEKNLTQYKDRLTLLPGDMLSLEHEQNSLAGVVGMYSIIHLPAGEQVQLLQKISNWLRPGGLLLANFSVQETEGTTVENWLDVDQAWMYWAGLGVKGTLDAISQMNLNVVEKEIVSGEGVDADFLWVLASKPL